jgi:hypothetical protein
LSIERLFLLASVPLLELDCREIAQQIEGLVAKCFVMRMMR